MSHLVQTMAYVGQTPWHQLGNQLPAKQSIDVWAQQAGMDWTICETPVRYMTEQAGSLGSIMSFDEQKARLAERLADPSKHWKYNPGDVDARQKWPAYMAAYEAALELCNTEAAPWHVIPSNKKWYRNWAVAELLRETLAGMGLAWPKDDFDVELEKRRVAES